MKLHIVAGCSLLAVVLCAGADPPVQRIDAHVHAGPPPDAFIQMLERLDVCLVNVTLVDPHVPGFDSTEPQTGWAAGIARASRGRIAWASTFDPAGFDQPGFVERTSKHLLSTFQRGAVAVKIYKSIGLDLKSASGRYVMPDDPAFGPVLEMIAANNRTVLAHLAEPRSSWQPLDPADPHYSYYKNNPDWHMFQHPERPSYESIIAARDRMLQAHPKLRVIGCHLGSMEYDVAEIAKRLDRYPNFAVDTAARTANLMLQPRDKVRNFLIRYQDRVLWGTDNMELRWENPEAVKRWEEAYARDWRYFATADTIDLGGRKIQGLALPSEVLRKVFHDNAVRWMPGIQDTTNCGTPPSAGTVIAKYIQALGGKEALSKITSRGAMGTFEAPTYGSYGRYEEYAAAPDKLLRVFRVERYGVVQRAFDGRAGWEESPEDGVTDLAGPRLAEVRRDAEFHAPLKLEQMASKLVMNGRTTLENRAAFEILANWPDGAAEKLFFDAETGLLMATESRETARDGSSRAVQLYYGDYRDVSGVKVPHTIRFVSPELIWIVKRQVAHNVPLDDARFRKP